MNFEPKTKAQFFSFLVFGRENIEKAVQELIDDMAVCEYIIHDKDKNEYDGQIHAHFMINYGNRTTLRWMKSAYGHLAVNEYIVPLSYPHNMDRYMVHDQKIERAKGKHVYAESEMHCLNGFDRDSLILYNEVEKMAFFDSIMKIVHDNKIYELSGLYEFLSGHDRILYRFALNNTILCRGYMDSHRNRNKK